MDQNYRREALQSSFEFIYHTGNPINCGEFGVINHAPLQTRIIWTRNYVELVNEFQIGCAIWTYKEMNFALVGNKSKVVGGELIKVTVNR